MNTFRNSIRGAIEVGEHGVKWENTGNYGQRKYSFGWPQKM